MKKININRNKLDGVLLQRQETSIDKWQNNNGKGTIIGPTGVGKTFIGLLGIERCYNSGVDKGYNRNVLVIVPTIVLKEQWEKLLEKFKIHNTTVLVANTAVKQEDHYDLIIFDEIHRFASATFSKCFNISHTFRIGFTASLERSDKKHKLIQQDCPVVDEITVNEALENGWISNFTIYNIPLQLSPVDRDELDRLTRKFNFYFATFGHDFDLAMNCLSQRHANAYARRLNRPEWDGKRIVVHAVQFSRAMKERKDLLYRAQCKRNSTAEVVKNLFTSGKVITFSQNTDLADQVSQDLNDHYKKEVAVSYHTNLPTITDKNGKKKGAITRRKENLNKFKDNRTRVQVINTAKALDEGFDVGDLEQGIILSGTAEPRQLVQRLGRLLRKKENKHAVLVCFYIEDSQDQKWLREAQKHIKKRNIVTTDLNTLLYGEENANPSMSLT